MEEKMKNLFINIFSAALALAVFTGCQSEGTVEDATPVNDNVGGVLPDPAGGIDTTLGGGFNAADADAARRGQWVDPNALAGNADADGWRPADPSGNNLGFPVIYFAYDSDVLVPSETANLDKIAVYLNNHPRLGLVIEGHCDNRGTDEYNRALGERRANAIRAYLAGRNVTNNRMKTMSFGEDKPAVEGSGEGVWKQNRRGVPVPMVMPR